MCMRQKLPQRFAQPAPTPKPTTNSYAKITELEKPTLRGSVPNTIIDRKKELIPVIAIRLALT